MAATAEKIETPGTELVIAGAAPAEISVNYEDVKANLEFELKKYDVVVTQDTVADAKKLATELNKNATEFNRFRKEAVERVSGPIRTFEDQMKSLSSMCKEGRQKLLDQIAVFEKETLDKAKSKMLEQLDSEWDHFNVSEEFRTASTDGLVKLTSVTAKGNLTAKVTNEIRSRVMADKSLEDQTQMRLLKLENQSYKAGLAAPLTRSHVEAFLFSDEDTYQKNLDAMLDSEKQRQSVAEEAYQQRMTTEAPKKEAEPDPSPSEDEPEMPAAAEEQSNVVPLQKTEANQPDAIVQQSVEYGYGPKDNMSKIRFDVSTRSQIEAKAIAEFPDGDIGIWTKEGLVVEIKRHDEPQA